MRRQRQIQSGAYAIRSRGRFDDLFWLAPQNRVDGVAPLLFADARNNRYSLNNQFVRASDIFALSSAAGKTYIDASGVLRTAGANELRVDHSNGVPEALFEGGFTDFITQREDISSTAWAAAALPNPSPATPNQGIAPNGNNVATLMSPSSFSPHRRALITALTAGATYTASIWVKRAPTGSATHFRLTANNTSVWLAGATRKVLLTDTWQRVTMTWSNINTANAYVHIGARTDTGSDDSDCFGDVLVWGAQAVAGPIAMSNVSTGVGVVAVTADICPLTVAARGVLLGSAGAVAARAVYPVNTIANSRLITLGSNSMITPSSGLVQSFTNNGTTSLVANTGSGSWASGAGGSVSWGGSGRRIAMNGGAVVEDAGTIGAGSTIHVGPSTGMQAGQIIRLRQLVGWTLADRASAAAVQAQARAA